MHLGAYFAYYLMSFDVESRIQEVGHNYLSPADSAHIQSGIKVYGRHSPTLLSLLCRPRNHTTLSERLQCTAYYLLL